MCSVSGPCNSKAKYCAWKGFSGAFQRIEHLRMVAKKLRDKSMRNKFKGNLKMIFSDKGLFNRAVSSVSEVYSF